jgi:hypothetical protein
MTFGSSIAIQKLTRNQKENGQRFLPRVSHFRLIELILKLAVSFTTPQGIDGVALDESDGPSTADEDVTTQPITQPISGTMMDMSMDGFASPNQQGVLLNQEHNHWESPLSCPQAFDSNGSPYNPSIQVLPVQLHAHSPLELTEREAFLFMTYIYKLAPLVSPCP